MTSSATLEPLPSTKTKSLGDRAAKSTLSFLKRFCLHHFPNRAPDARIPYRQSDAAKALGVAQGYLSDVWNEKKKPGFAIVVGLAYASGAGLQEITGIRPNLEPKHPFSTLSPDAAVATAAAEASHWGSNERPSGTTPAATPVRKPRR